MPERVVVAMSGGVDSSVALLKVLEAGYDAIGVTMKLWESRDVGGNLLEESNCCPIEAINMARDVCVSLGVPHYTLDFQEVFQKTVIDNFVAEYVAGRTPNPCVRCNSYVKWDALIDYADEIGADKIATGHYARIGSDENGQPQLLKGIDEHKDQSYVLWGIPRETLQRTLLPLGDMTKREVRDMALEKNLATALVPESQDICFVSDNNYRRFLNEHATEEMAAIKPGSIVNEAGERIGEHGGYVNYTIGQRRGLGVAAPEPLYVKELDTTSNTVTVAPKTSLFHLACEVGDLNWLVDKPQDTIAVQARVRYNSVGSSAQLSFDDGHVILRFNEPQLAITAGQSATFFQGDTLLGGGVIRRNLG